jgi:hypothetical protein
MKEIDKMATKAHVHQEYNHKTQRHTKKRIITRSSERVLHSCPGDEEGENI